MSKKNKKSKVKNTASPFSPWPFPTGGVTSKEPEQLELFKPEGLSYVHVRNELGYSYTFAYCPTVEGRKANFVDIGVAVCSPEDQFNKALGRGLATSRLLNGEYMTLPLGMLGKENIPRILHLMFCEEDWITASLYPNRGHHNV